MLRHVEEVGEHIGRYEGFEPSQVAVGYVLAQRPQNTHSPSYGDRRVGVDDPRKLRRVGMVCTYNSDKSAEGLRAPFLIHAPFDHPYRSAAVLSSGDRLPLRQQGINARQQGGIRSAHVSTPT